MTKDEAIAQMEAGKKVTHNYFTDEEWISMKNGRVINEEGYDHDAKLFWANRQGEQWDKDWTIFYE